ncbi:MAG: hypothetical protein ACOC8X_11560 [Chloroflexota bacterium]
MPLELRNEDAPRPVLAFGVALDDNEAFALRLTDAIAWHMAARELSDAALARRLLEDVWSDQLPGTAEEALLAEAVHRLEGHWSREQMIGARA